MRLKKLNKIILFFIIFTFFYFVPSLISQTIEVKSGTTDIGKMWTFDYPPVEYLSKTYHFKPDKEWFEKARLASLRLPGCSAGFVTEDGLIITNHHCARGALSSVAKEGEDLLTNGFFARSLEDERKVPNLYVDQLVLIKDITMEVQTAFESGKTDDERVKNRDQKIREIEEENKSKTGLICNVVTFYNGGKYSLYGYKRYKDIRLVFAPESMMGFFGGDPDNFTFPRYDLDMSFMRVYDDNGKPFKSENYYKFSKGGAKEGDLVFVIGNPGRTNRLNTIAQLEFNRDYSYPFILSLLDNVVSIYKNMTLKYPEKKVRYQNILFGYTNSQKVYANVLKGLNNPYLMAKKNDFEKKFREVIDNTSILKSKYSNIWSEIANLQKEKSAIFREYAALNFKRMGFSTTFSLVSDIVDYANMFVQPPKDLKAREERLKLLKSRTYSQIDEIEKELLIFQLKNFKSIYGESNHNLNKLLGNIPIKDAVNVLSESTILTNKDKALNLLDNPPEKIYNSDDPFISFVIRMQDRIKELRTKYEKIVSLENAKIQLLGMALHEVYGTSIPPDGTFTLRFSDGVVKTYEYNGTIAPPITTFYGLYDKYYSFGKQDPWDLPERWRKPPPEFDLKTPFNFVSTADTYGGNSGSPVVNKDLQVVGLNFDRNIEGMPREFIYTDETARNVCVHSEGILEALRDMYKADRIVKELQRGKIGD
jgi:hypothetical protein